MPETHGTINCREALTRLQDYLKHDLTPEREAELRAHLDYCRPCEGYARFEQSFLQMLEARARRCTCPAELRARIERELGLRKEPG